MSREPVNLSEARRNTNVHDAFGADTGGRRFPHSGRDWHPIKAGAAVPIYAIEAGTVIKAGGSNSDTAGPGLHVVVRSAANRFYLYGHLSSRAVAAGSTLAEGARIGAMGNSGGSLGVHLHVTLFTTQAAAMANAAPSLRAGRTVAAWASANRLADPLTVINNSNTGGGGSSPTKGTKVRILRNHKPKLKVTAGAAARVPLDKNGHGTLRNDLDKNRVVTDAKIASITANFNITAKAGNKYRIYGQRLSWDAKKKLWVPRVGVGTKDFVIPKNGTISDQFTLNTYIPDGQRILYRIKLLSGKGAGTVNSVYIHGWME